jgi:hypothetical protein
MNDSTLVQLQIIVERAVRPVEASTSRKRKMREELLAHVTGVFEEESIRSGDDQVAVERATRRFGAPAEVTSQLQESVPASDWVERFWQGRPGETVLRGALRLACAFQAFMLVVCGIAVLVAGWDTSWSRAELCAVLSRWDFIPQLSVGPLYVFFIAFVAHGMEKSLHGPEPIVDWPRIGLIRSFVSAWSVRAVRLAIIVGGSCFVTLMCLRIATWSTEVWDWGAWTMIAAGLLFAGDLAATSVLAAWVLVQSADARRRYHEEWSRLPIDS